MQFVDPRSTLKLGEFFVVFFIPSHADEPIYLKWLKCDALRNLIPCVQFKIRENTLGGVLHLVKLQAKVLNFAKSNLPPWVFSKFFYCTNGAKSCKAADMCYSLAIATK